MENKKRWNRRLGKIIIILLISLSALVSWIYSNIKEEKNILSLGYQETSKVTITSADNQYQYEVNSDDENTITITKYIGSEQEIEIPNTLDGYTVTSIGDYAFRYNTSLINIIIPNSVTSIETGAFYGCSVLKNITLPEYLTTIESYTFYNCTNLETIIIPDNVSNIKYSAFNGCSGLTSINLPDTITTIGYSAFARCTSLTSIIIPDFVTSIEQSTFYNCTSLETIVIPDSVTSIGESAFSNTLWYNNQPDGVIYINKILYCYKGTMPENTEIIVKDGIERIEKNAFKDQTELTSISISNSVTSIEYRTFYGCTGLRSVILPNSLTSIGQDAFYGCTSLSNITLPDSLTSIGKSAFFNCDSLTNITIPKNVESISAQAFDSCNSLSQIEVDSGNTYYSSIDGVLFYIGSEETFSHTLTEEYSYTNASIIELVQYPIGNTRTEYTVPVPNSTVVTIGPYAFHGSTNLEKVIISPGVVSIGTSATISCGVNNVLYSNPEYSGWYLRGGQSSFSSCTNLKEVSLPDTLIYVAESSFRYCTSLKSIYIPKNVKKMDWYAFANCTSLESVVYAKDSVAFEVSDYGFQGCTALTSIVLPAKMTSIDGAAFSGCSNLKGIIIRSTTLKLEYNVLANCSSDLTLFYNNTRSSSDEVESYASANGISTYSGETLQVATNTNTVDIATMLADYGFTYAMEYSIDGGEIQTYDGPFIINTNGEHEITTYLYVGDNVLYETATTTVEITGNIEKHTVTYNYSQNGGTQASKTTEEIAENTSIDLTPTATKEGWNFVGWNTSSTSTTGLDSLTMQKTDITLYAIYSKTLTVKCYYYSGTNLENKTVQTTLYNSETEGKVALPTLDVTYTGWTKNGWTSKTASDAEVEVAEGETITLQESKTYYMLYKKTITLTLYDDSKVFYSATGTATTNTYNANFIYGASIKIPDLEPTKVGYTFAGTWNTQTDGQGVNYDYDTHHTFEEDTNLYANWTANENTAYTEEIYTMNTSGTYEKTSSNIKYGTTGAEVEIEVEEKEGFRYEANRSNTAGTIAADGSTVLTVYYERNKYTLALVSGTGISKVEGTGSYYYEEEITVKATTKTGYNWKNWTGEGIENIGEQEFITTMPAGNLTLTANAELETYTITYNLNGGSLEGGIQNPESYTVETESFTLINPSKTGYTFAGWTKGNETTSQTQITVNKGTTGNLSFTANWIANGNIAYTEEIYTMNTSGNYEKTSSNTKYGTTGAEVEIEVEEKEGFRYEANRSNIAGTIAADGSTVLTVYYERNKYTLALVSGTGISEVEGEGSYYYEEEISVKATTKPGYNWKNWTGEGIESIVEQEFITTMPAGNLTLTANAELETYTIRYNLNGGNLVEGVQNPESYTVETETFTLINPSKTGYTFAGWTQGNDTTNQTQITISKGTTGNLSFTANWEPATEISYTVQHYQMNLDGETYQLMEVENLTGTTQEKVTPAVKTYIGFTSPKEQTVTIEAAGSTIVEYYYTRNQYSLILVAGTGISEVKGAGTYYYGEKITIEAEVEDGYNWKNWSNGEETINDKQITIYMPANNLKITANAEQKVIEENNQTTNSNNATATTNNVGNSNTNVNTNTNTNISNLANNNNNNNNSVKTNIDNTIAQTAIPQTGQNVLVGILILVMLLTMIIIYYQKYKKIEI